jgi:putative transposase
VCAGEAWGRAGDLNAHEDLKGAAAKVLKATWQGRSAHFQLNALAHAGKGHCQVVLAQINTVFAQDSHEAATKSWRTVADQLRAKFPKLAM